MVGEVEHIVVVKITCTKAQLETKLNELKKQGWQIFREKWPYETLCPFTQVYCNGPKCALFAQKTGICGMIHPKYVEEPKQQVQ